MSKPWYIDVATLLLAGLWMYGTISLIHKYGPSWTLIGGMLVVVIAVLMVVHYRRIKRLEIGNWALVEYHEERPPHERRGDAPEEREKYR